MECSSTVTRKLYNAGRPSFWLQILIAVAFLLHRGGHVSGSCDFSKSSVPLDVEDTIRYTIYCYIIKEEKRCITFQKANTWDRMLETGGCRSSSVAIQMFATAFSWGTYLMCPSTSRYPCSVR